MRLQADFESMLHMREYLYKRRIPLPPEVPKEMHRIIQHLNGYNSHIVVKMIPGGNGVEVTADTDTWRMYVTDGVVDVFMDTDIRGVSVKIDTVSTDTPEAIAYMMMRTADE